MRSSESKVTSRAHDTTSNQHLQHSSLYGLQQSTRHSVALLSRKLKKELRFHSLSTDGSFTPEGPFPPIIEANLSSSISESLEAAHTHAQSQTTTINHAPHHSTTNPSSSPPTYLSSLYLLLGPQQGKPQSEFKIHSHRETFIRGKKQIDKTPIMSLPPVQHGAKLKEKSQTISNQIPQSEEVYGHMLEGGR